MARAHRQTGEPALAQDPSHMTLGHLHLELLGDDGLQIHATPAHNAMRGDIGASLDKRVKVFEMCFLQPRWAPRARTIREPGNPLFVVAMHPIAQGLAGHPARLGGVRSRRSLDHQSDRQHPARLRHIAHPARPSPQVSRRQIRTCDGHWHVSILPAKSVG